MYLRLRVTVPLDETISRSESIGFPLFLKKLFQKFVLNFSKTLSEKFLT